VPDVGTIKNLWALWPSLSRKRQSSQAYASGLTVTAMVICIASISGGVRVSMPPNFRDTFRRA